MDVEDVDPKLGEAMLRSLGKRGTYLDAHVLALALLRERRRGEIAAVVAVAGWALVLAWCLDFAWRR